MSSHGSDTPVETSLTAHADEVVAALKVLRGFGMTLVQGLVDEPADGAERRTSVADAALAYARISRAVRLTCVLEMRIAHDAAEQRSADARARVEAERHAEHAAHDAGHAAKEIAALTVSAILQDGKDDGDLPEAEAERLQERLDDWADDEDEAEAFAHLGQAEILEAVCQALEIMPDPGLWAEGRLVEAITCAIRPGWRPRAPFNPFPNGRPTPAKPAPRERVLEPAEPP